MAAKMRMGTASTDHKTAKAMTPNKPHRGDPVPAQGPKKLAANSAGPAKVRRTSHHLATRRYSPNGGRSDSRRTSRLAPSIIKTPKKPTPPVCRAASADESYRQEPAFIAIDLGQPADEPTQPGGRPERRVCPLARLTSSAELGSGAGAGLQIGPDPSSGLQWLGGGLIDADLSAARRARFGSADTIEAGTDVVVQRLGETAGRAVGNEGSLVNPLLRAAAIVLAALESVEGFLVS